LGRKQLRDRQRDLLARRAPGAAGEAAVKPGAVDGRRTEATMANLMAQFNAERAATRQGAGRARHRHRQVHTLKPAA